MPSFNPYLHIQKSTETLIYRDKNRTRLGQKTGNNNAYNVWNNCLRQTGGEWKEAKARHTDHRAGGNMKQSKQPSRRQSAGLHARRTETSISETLF